MTTRVFVMLAWFAPLGAPVYPVGVLAVRPPDVRHAARVPLVFETGRAWRVRLRGPLTSDQLEAWVEEGWLAEADPPPDDLSPVEAADELLSRLLSEVLPAFDEWSR